MARKLKRSSASIFKISRLATPQHRSLPYKRSRADSHSEAILLQNYDSKPIILIFRYQRQPAPTPHALLAKPCPLLRHSLFIRLWLRRLWEERSGENPWYRISWHYISFMSLSELLWINGFKGCSLNSLQVPGYILANSRAFNPFDGLLSVQRDSFLLGLLQFTYILFLLQEMGTRCFCSSLPEFFPSVCI